MNLPSLSFAEFASLAGPELYADLRRLYVGPENRHLVLFSDPIGEHIAILPVGPSHAYASLEIIASGVEIEGLSPLCSLRTPGAAAGPVGGLSEAESERLQTLRQELEQRESSLHMREQSVAECEARMGEVDRGLAEREAMIEQREQVIAARERAFFPRMGEIGRDLAQREAMIEQREQVVAARERAFFQRSGEQAPGFETNPSAVGA